METTSTSSSSQSAAVVLQQAPSVPADLDTAGIGSSVAESAMGTEHTRVLQEIKAQVFMAKAHPRDELAAFERIRKSCLRPGLAEKAIYKYPRGGAVVTGPSIRLAETIARAWGNIRFGTVELSRNWRESTMYTYCWDMETNVLTEKKFTVDHTRDTKQGTKQLTDQRDIYEMVANYGARRLRSCILATIPEDVIDEAVKQCKETLAVGVSKNIEDKKRSMVKAFDEVGVTKAMIEERLGHGFDAITVDEMVDLHTIYTAIRDKMSSRDKFFSVGPGQKDEAEAEVVGEVDEKVSTTVAPKMTNQDVVKKYAKARLSVTAQLKWEELKDSPGLASMDPVALDAALSRAVAGKTAELLALHEKHVTKK